MKLSDLYEYLNGTGWVESKQFAQHYVRQNTHGIVAIDATANEAYIVEHVGEVPWSRITDIEQFERDLAHLQ